MSVPTSTQTQKQKSIQLFLIMVAIVSVASIMLVQGANPTGVNPTLNPGINPTGAVIITGFPPGTVVNLGPKLQTEPYRPDSHTVLLCGFNTDGKCRTSTGGTTSAIVNPLKNTFSYFAGMFGTGGASITPINGVGIYPTTYQNLSFTPNLGTMEAWVKLNPTNQPKEQYLFTVKGVNSINGDQYPDLFYGESTTSTNAYQSAIYFGNATGIDTTDAARKSTILTQVPRGTAMADVDGDGKLDLAISENTANRVSIYKGYLVAGQAYTTPDITLTVTTPQGLALTDLDNDGDVDVAVSQYSGGNPVLLFENDGAGNFTQLVTTLGPLAFSAEGLLVFDADQDGIKDVYASSFTTQVFKYSMLFYGKIVNGKYTIQISNPTDYQLFHNPGLGAGAADFDRDGWMDIAIPDLVNDTVYIYYNDKTGKYPDNGTFVNTFYSKTGFTANGVNIDNDEYMDLIVTGYKGATATTVSTAHLGKNDFTTSITYPVNNAVSLALGNKVMATHSSTDNSSPYFTLNYDGVVTATSSVTSQSTFGNPGGPGSGEMWMYSSSFSNPYGMNHAKVNQYELKYVPKTGKMVFTVWDNGGKAHKVEAPFNPSLGWQHVAVQYDAGTVQVPGKLQLIIGDPKKLTNYTTYTAPGKITMGSVFELRIGTDEMNMNPLNGKMDEFRISDSKRYI